MKDQLSFTIDATNVLILNETAEMLKRIANAQCPAMAVVHDEVEYQTTPEVELAVAVAEGFVPTPNDAFDAPEVVPYHVEHSLPRPPLSTVLLDSAGMPWDERIHASTKSKVKDGTWTFKRGLDEATKGAVLAEYGEPVEDGDEPEADVTPPAPEPTPPAPEPEWVQAPTPPPPTPSTSSVSTFLELMPAIRAKGVNQADTLAACQALGLPNLIAFNLPANQVMIPELATLLGL